MRKKPDYAKAAKDTSAALTEMKIKHGRLHGYHLGSGDRAAADYSENNDLAASMPDKLKEMQALFHSEGMKYNVYPLDNSVLPRIVTPRPSATAGKTVFTYTGENVGIPTGNAPNILDRDYRITADVTIPDGGTDGMIATMGGRFGGYALYLSRTFNWWFHEALIERVCAGLFVLGLLLAWIARKRGISGWRASFAHGLWVLGFVAAGVVFLTGAIGFGRGRPVFLYNFLDLQRFKWEGPALSAGNHTVVFDFKYNGPGPAKGGTGVLSVDGKEVDRKTIEHTIPVIMTIDETFDIGGDTRTPVDDLEYEIPFRFGGKIDTLTYKIGPSQMSPEEQSKTAAMLARAKD